ncbi:putative 5-oxoprolinase [Cryphonectria parasitica EP155]|uniref:5-oxoprolinase n=1 Tax=Cryphonectria parasitica (strain ATCC 38755 / EP155) TaxID=660469 RepID=A0A9P5CM07_CRYP1|nr:putative 5-oxoprolinase [Cryphonectria parasitica EP155]KAF3762591.1 putative 5-oxoprolinase [Cryphonectria parasitica EP155]
MPSIAEEGIRIAIDRGGTFCDFWAHIPGQKDDLVFKLLSVCPDEFADAPTEGIRQILEKATGRAIARGELLDLTPVESIRMGTTVATNALLERKGESTALLITKGFRDLLIIGNQARPRIFDLAVKKLGTLYENVVEVDERVTAEGFSEDPEPQPIDVASDCNLVIGKTGEPLRILKRPDLDAVRKDLQGLWDSGFRSLAVALMHSYAYPDHEMAIGDLAREMGFKVSLSSQLQSMIKLVPRAQSAVADAYLSPITENYLEGFRRSFKGELRDQASANKLLLCQSHGGLVRYTEFTGLRAILSGPAGGVIGYARTCYDVEEGTPVLGFDMGGTSTDVSRYGGTLEHVFECTTAEIQIQTPQLDVNTVAAGGGSILFWSNGLFKVGPQSAGAYPGPVCYGNGGPLTITDANCFLGRVLPDYFPRKLHIDKVREEFAKLTRLVNSEKNGDDQLTAEQVAMGFIEVANATMARPIRTLSEGRGFDTAAHNLACFGGAGGQHAVAIARDLGIRRVLIHRLSSILSAYGMALADIVVEKQEPEAAVYGSDSKGRIAERFASMAEKATSELGSQGIPAQRVLHEYFLNMRYRGSDTALMIQKPEDGDFSQAFSDRHQREFGFGQPDRDILVDDVRVRSIGKAVDIPGCSLYRDLEEEDGFTVLDASSAKAMKKVYFGTTGWTDTAIFHITNIPRRVKIMGPAVAIDATQTIIIEEDSVAIVLDDHIVLDITASNQRTIGIDEVDPVQLSVFGHRFMSIAEQMGRTLQKTSISTNIKERLDYSCAIFSQSGGLVANAPHIPGHLGSMSTAIRYQAEKYGPTGLKPGDVVLSNHPCSGGTHLPDLTVTTPVFDDNDNPTQILFFVANRGHHADIGGILAGSMPPNSTELWQEGAAVESFKMVKQGVFDEEGLIDELYVKPGKYPGCSGTRTLKDNIADLKAAVAANNRGIHLIQALVKEYSWPVVQFYMEAIQKNAEDAVRTLLKGFSERFRGHPLKAVDYMDDGTPLALKVTIDGDSGSAKFDFTGTGPEAFNNLNTPSAVMYSGIIYCLRCMISSEIPLNQGCLTPIEVYCPPNTLLSPSLKAATVGSNVETSQRIVDLIFKAFRACAASQGTCNNLTFGYGGTDPETGKITKGFGYYETIAGGAGAGPTWDGQSGVHTNVTNTRITDPETFEKRYPVILREFSIRKGSGGAGFHRGGDGCVRDIELTRPMQVSILSERRVIPPYGMAGGCEGGRGVNIWVRKDPEDDSERRISLGPRATTMMGKGDRIIVQTPGGGGYGKDPNAEEDFVPPEELQIRELSKSITNGVSTGSSAFRANGSVAEREAMGASN